MFVVIYTFTVKENRDRDFIEGWKGLTRLIYEYERSLGSRLHKKSKNKYVAYAQWPDRTTWENAGENLPEIANVSKRLMKDSCETIETILELDVLEDLIQSKIF